MKDSNRNLWLTLGGVAVIFIVICLCVVTVSAGVTAVRSVTTQVDRVPVPAVLVPQVETEEAVVPERATPAPRAPIQIEPGSDVETEVLMAIYEQVNPSVVNITLFGRAGDQTIPGIPLPTPENPDELVPIGQGSGFVWDADGHIVTNAHVVADADQVQVTFADGTYAVAEVVGSDLDSDLAVVKVDPTHATLSPITRGNMDEVRVGQRAIAIGNPFGYANTMTQGIISAIGRTISSLTAFNIPSVIQTDAPINPGNSGGPLLNALGEVIGVNAQIETGGTSRANSGVGFAIPVSIVERVIPALIDTGVYRHAFLGLSGSTFTPFCADVLGLDPELRGAYVQEVTDDGPSGAAGLRGGSTPTNSNVCPPQAGGDLIIAIGDQPVTRFDDLLVYLELRASPGDTVTLTVLRDGEEVQIPVELGRRPTRTEE